MKVKFLRAQELRESRGGRLGLPDPESQIPQSSGAV